MSSRTVTPDEAEQVERPARWYEGTRGFLTATLVIYAAARAFSALVLYLVGLHQVDVGWFEGETGYLRMTVLWDSFWYRQIVEDGYPAVLPRDPASGKLWQNPWAFYPMFPMTTRYLMQLTGAGFAAVGSTLALFFGGVSAVLMALLMRHQVGARVALAVIAVWATCITSPTLQVAYTESMALALLCAVLIALTHRRWWTASLIAMLTGLTRPIALPLGVVALVTVFLRWRERRENPVPVREWVAMFGTLVACGLSGLVWPFIVWRGTGVLKGYTETMTAWRQYDDIYPFIPWIDKGEWITHNRPLTVVLFVLLVVAVLAIAAGPWARALGPQLRAWCMAYPFYLFAALDPTTSIYRYVICLFPWVVVMVGAGWGEPGRDPLEPVGEVTTADGRSRARAILTSRRLWTLTAMWVAFGLLTQVWWVWEIWQFTPPADDPP